MRGVALLAAALRRRPLAAVAALGRDYLVWVGMVAFALVLVLSRWPLAALDRACKLHTRERLVELVAALAHG